MPAKPKSRNWNDVQTAIATVAIVSTLGMWNLFATPSKTEITQPNEPVVPPTEPPVAAVPTLLPQVKIMFTPMPSAAPQTSVAQQTQNNKKKKNKNNNDGGGGGSVTQTKTS